MLVLGRREGESVKIGDDVYVMVTSVNRNNGVVRLGFTAPNHILIDREEIVKRRLENPWPAKSTTD